MKPKTPKTKFIPPPYSETGPVWTVVPHEYTPECCDFREVEWFVVDLDYDAKNFTGHSIATCNSEDDAIAVARALNNHTFSL